MEEWFRKAAEALFAADREQAERKERIDKQVIVTKEKTGGSKVTMSL